MITILRLNHRIERDKRATTHVFLSSRTLGADNAILSGEEDENTIKTVESVSKRWGGSFKVIYEKNWKKAVEEKKRQGFKVVHLTMYGERFTDVLPKLKKEKNILIAVGSEKVPAEMYQLADYNVSVGNQPHSEIAALAVFLYELKGKEALYSEKENAKLIVKPNKRGKTVLKKN